jgi:integrase/recombinase XerD
MPQIKNTKIGSVYPFLDARTPMANSDLLPVKISVILRGKQFRIGVKLYTTPDVFNKAMTGKGTIGREAKILKDEIDVYVKKAKEILEQFPTADKKMFTNLFRSESALKVSGKTDMGILFKQKIDELIEEDRAGSISFYEQALSTFKRFRRHFYLEDITVEYLKAFKAWWINKGNSNATAQIHMRSLRHIFNRAIKQGYISPGLYPFKDYSIGTSSKSKDVLYPEQLKALLAYVPTSYGETRSRDYFIFLYLCNGMNIKDALSIKGSQIKGDMLTFVRAKTSKTNSQTKEIMVYLHPEAKRIIEKWGTLNTNDYIFPCFRGTKSDLERKKAKDIFARNLNRDMRPIGRSLGLNMNLTLNLARHSFATRLKIDGTPTSFISDALGHSSSAVTAHYMKTLPDNKYKEMSESLLKF